MTEDTIAFREYPVNPLLAPFVKCIWSLESDNCFFGAARERILPDSCVELVFHCRDPFLTHFANRTTARQPQAFVVGQMKRFLEIEPAGRIGLIAVRFYARGAYLFFHRPLSEVAAGVVDLQNVWTERATVLTERIGLARDMEERVRILEQELLRLLAQDGRFDKTTDRCLQMMETTEGQISISRLAANVGVSNRQLTRQFQQTVGLTPKHFARISRFLNVLRRLSEGRYKSLTETALACGYYDQAHLNHEFREMAGMAPGELFTFPNVAF
jgi:AraC-like DNA-binding protein